MGLLRTILIILIVYYVIRFIVRLALPFLVKSMFRQNTTHKDTNNTTSSSKSKKGGDSELGEYVDFEEIE